MRSDKLQETDWGVDGHPSTELLRQYEEGVLSAELSHELERHLMDCEVCDDILTGMALTDRSHTQQAKSKILQHIKLRLRKHRKKTLPLLGLGDWRVALAVLMMFCSLGLLLFYYYTRSVENQAANTLAGTDTPPSPEELLARTIDSALVLEIQAPPATPVHLMPEKPDQAASLSPEHKEIRGTVVSEDGQGIASVRVQVQGTNITATSDATGSFRIDLPPGKQILLFSGLGYKAVQKEVSEPVTKLRVQLRKDR